MVDVVWYYYRDTERPERAPVVYTHSTTAPFGWTFEGERVKFTKSNPDYVLMAVEPAAQYRAARDVRGVGEEIREWEAKRAAQLAKKRKGIVHPQNDNITAVDTVYWLEDDPHPVNGLPTLFVSDQEVRNYGCVILGLPIAEVESRLRERSVFSINTN